MFGSNRQQEDDMCLGMCIRINVVFLLVAGANFYPKINTLCSLTKLISKEAKYKEVKENMIFFTIYCRDFFFLDVIVEIR